MLKFAAAGTSFYYRKVGHGPRPVVLLHGFGNSSAMWLPFVWPLRQQFTFYLPDLPGFGASKEVPLLHDRFLEVYATAIETWLESLGEGVFLGGFSLGAYTCLQLHAQGGFKRVARYLHVDHTPYPLPDEGWEGTLSPQLLALFAKLKAQIDAQPEQARVLLSELMPAARVQYFEILEVLGNQSLTRPLLRWANRIAHRAPVLRRVSTERAAWQWAYAMIRHYCEGTYDFRQIIRAIGVPTTILAPTDSRLFNASAARFMVKNIKGSRLIEFDRSGHDLVFNEPIRFFKQVREFLA